MTIDLIAGTVARCPDHPAILTASGTVPYRELWHRAGLVAGTLRDLGVRPGETVGLLAPPSLDGVVGLLAILRTGAVYVPLCPTLPPGRIDAVVEDAGAPLVLCAREVAADAVVSAKPVWIHRAATSSGGRSPEDPVVPPVAHPESPLALVYTSGSTGTPKGVLVPHRAMRNRLGWGQRTYPLCAGDRVLHHTRYIYDFSAWEVLATLSYGATLVVEPVRNYPDYEEIIGVIQRLRVTVAHFVPAVLAGLVSRASFRACHSLTTVFAGGEALSQRLAGDFAAACGATLYNQYGPTETCVDSSFFRYDEPPAPAATVPIGRAIDGTRLHVLDHRLRPVPAGGTGELYIGGEGLATGYAARPRLTAERFVPNPFRGGGERMYRTGDLVRDLGGGMLEFVGRADLQVSLRGVRLELTEVEHVLETHPHVIRAVAMVSEDERPCLVAWVLPAAGHEVDAAALRALARAVLPPAAVPDQFHFGQSLPLLPTGKIDRAAIRRLVAAAEVVPVAGGSKPGDAAGVVHDRLLAIWRDLLGVPEVGVHDDFFDLGGHSLLAVELVGMINEQLGTDVPLAGFFEAPTVMSVAELIDQAGGPPKGVG